MRVSARRARIEPPPVIELVEIPPTFDEGEISTSSISGGLARSAVVAVSGYPNVKL
jgi:hypothetical protein